MRIVQSLLVIVGALLLLAGLLFAAQGAGWVRWPAESFMIGQSAWVTRGLGSAVIGLGCVLIARRMRA